MFKCGFEFKSIVEAIQYKSACNFVQILRGRRANYCLQCASAAPKADRSARDECAEAERQRRGQRTNERAAAERTELCSESPQRYAHTLRITHSVLHCTPLHSLLHWHTRTYGTYVSHWHRALLICTASTYQLSNNVLK